MKRLRPYLKTFLVIFTGIAVITTGMYWGVKTWGMRQIGMNIDWATFIQFNNITYLAAFLPDSITITPEQLVPYDTVRFRLAENMNDPYYCIKNGDAAFLEVGTPVFSIKDYSPLFRLWAGGILFEADTNPKARRGSDLLDIGGKVEYIETNMTERNTVKDPEHVACLVDMVLNASVNQKVPAEEKQIFVYFHLKDGTIVNRSYWPAQGQLHRGIMLPEEFWEILKMGDGENP